VVTVIPFLSGRVENTVIIAEMFGSVQGEGPWSGQRCVFVRFSRCNLRCSWCDTSYTWNWTQYTPTEVSTRIPITDLVGWVADQDVDLMVITGGEPMLQQPAMTALAAGVPDRVRVQVETNGTQPPDPALVELVDLWVVSPKLSNSGMNYRSRIVPAALTGLMATGRAAFKFVVTDPGTDFAEVAELVGEFGLTPVWVMPEGDTREKVLAGMDAITKPAVARGWNVCTRLHILTGVR
jgi:7-carboxy-7-deazaguanine synthase